jgi:hypothetical protein
MIVLLVVGFLANELIRPVNPVYHEPRAAQSARQDPLVTNQGDA